MNERRDDTTKPEAESRPAREPGSYYYDDATGYETYTPEADESEADGPEDEAPADEAPKDDEQRAEATARDEGD